MKYIYTALFTPIEDGSGYYAKVPDLPGCITTGNSLSDAIDQITDAMSAWLVVAEDEGEPIAPPSPQEKLDRYSRRSKKCFSSKLDGPSC